MHIQQGVAEIKALNWDEEAMTLSFTATRPVGEKGSVIISALRVKGLYGRKLCS